MDIAGLYMRCGAMVSASTELKRNVRLHMSSSVRIVDALAQICAALFLLIWAIARTFAKCMDYFFRIAMSVLSP